MKKAELKVEVAHDDVDDVVEIATRMMVEDEGKMSLEEVQAVGEELDIPAEYIARAQTQLVEKRAKQKQELEAEAASRRTLVTMSTVGVAALAFIIMVWIGATASSLGSLHAQVVSTQAQVQNVTERKESVVELYKDRPTSPDKDAELVGAENRIRVETKRYSEAASAYNAKVRGFPGNIARTFKGLPSEVPASPEL